VQDAVIGQTSEDAMLASAWERKDVSESGSGSSPPLDAKTQDRLFDVYKEVCHNIRVTNEISFKLLRTVPLVAGISAGVLTLFGKNATPVVNVPADLALSIVAPLSVIGALITFGLYRWECRNIATCRWLIGRAAHLERKLFRLRLNKGQSDSASEPEMLLSVQYAKMRKYLDKPAFDSSWLRWKWCTGKRQAEMLIYLAATIVWGVPVLVALLNFIHPIAKR
jgi:hypothetical protein